jgi:hypothetical protein
MSLNFFLPKSGRMIELDLETGINVISIFGDFDQFSAENMATL